MNFLKQVFKIFFSMLLKLMAIVCLLAIIVYFNLTAVKQAALDFLGWNSPPAEADVADAQAVPSDPAPDTAEEPEPAPQPKPKPKKKPAPAPTPAPVTVPVQTNDSYSQPYYVPPSYTPRGFQERNFRAR